MVYQNSFGGDMNDILTERVTFLLYGGSHSSGPTRAEQGGSGLVFPNDPRMAASALNDLWKCVCVLVHSQTAAFFGSVETPGSSCLWYDLTSQVVLPVLPRFGAAFHLLASANGRSTAVVIAHGVLNTAEPQLTEEVYAASFNTTAYPPVLPLAGEWQPFVRVQTDGWSQSTLDDGAGNAFGPILTLSASDARLGEAVVALAAPPAQVEACHPGYTPPPTTQPSAVWACTTVERRDFGLLFAGGCASASATCPLLDFRLGEVIEAPKLDSLQFSDTGASIDVRFSDATDLGCASAGRGAANCATSGSSGSFPCDMLFNLSNGVVPPEGGWETNVPTPAPYDPHLFGLPNNMAQVRLGVFFSLRCLLRSLVSCALPCALAGVRSLPRYNVPCTHAHPVALLCFVLTFFLPLAPRSARGPPTRTCASTFPRAPRWAITTPRRVEIRGCYRPSNAAPSALPTSSSTSFPRRFASRM